jgi:hypothetical protein
MLDIPKVAFSYLAFNQRSEKLLTYGESAQEAGQWACEVAPTAQIQVVCAGAYGRTIWNRKISLSAARRALRRVQQPPPRERQHF